MEYIHYSTSFCFFHIRHCVQKPFPKFHNRPPECPLNPQQRCNISIVYNTFTADIASHSKFYLCILFMYIKITTDLQCFGHHNVTLLFENKLTV